ncbi:MAG TPA: DUF3793 family protein [Candidatus Ornithospirochaeta stercorigallinarum]|nr:DUF3793 family protein [Candidatus Ornithospirochaeta stercorigallinarum]
MTFPQLLARYAAPTLAGMKCASLVSLKPLNGHIDEWIPLLEEKGLRFFHLKTERSIRLVLVYREEMLSKALSTQEAKSILRPLGYDEEMKTALEHLRTRFLSVPCPHEIGLFLGYPANDVIGFIENNGSNFKLSGLWKVYGDEESALRLFARYEKCRKAYISFLENGANLIKLCKKTA